MDLDLEIRRVLVWVFCYWREGLFPLLGLKIL